MQKKEYLYALAENADRPFLSKLSIELPAQDESVEDASSCGNHARESLRRRCVGLGAVAELRPKRPNPLVVFGEVVQ